jgi:hypothetical protein
VGGSAGNCLGRTVDAEHLQDARAAQISCAGQVRQGRRELGKDEDEFVVQPLARGGPCLNQVAARTGQLTHCLDVLGR